MNLNQAAVGGMIPFTLNNNKEVQVASHDKQTDMYHLLECKGQHKLGFLETRSSHKLLKLHSNIDQTENQN